MSNLPTRPAYPRKRPAPRKAPGAPRQISDTVVWDRVVDPVERYRILYLDRDGKRTERVITLKKIGTSEGTRYYGVEHEGKFKTLRVDRVIGVLEQLTKGHEPSIRPMPTYGTTLPPFPIENAVFRVPTIAVSTRTWRVDLNRYTCTCPEKRVRMAKGYVPGQLGYVCPHVARAILAHLPADAAWSPGLLDFLRDPRRMHVDTLT